MPIAISELENRARQYYLSKRMRSLSEAKRTYRQTAFLSHSHDDSRLAKGLQMLLNDFGWDVYIDWEDNTMPETPNRQTAINLQSKIRTCDWFLFLATPNSMISRWCPWEIGYADGVKPTDSILIVPTRDRSGNYHGNEYLQLYRKIELTSDDNLGAFRPTEDHGPYIRNLQVAA